MARPSAIAVIDIGKSNAKLALVDAASRATLAVRTVTNAVISGPPYPHYDVEHLWGWLVEGLRVFAGEAHVTAISVATHGACFALLAGGDLALPIVDYECTALEEVHAACLEEKRWEFLTIGLPLRLPGATGCPWNPIAMF